MSGHAPKGRRKGGHEEEHENHERWLVSYADMITVLMALFIVLFAISQVDQQKYVELKQSLAAGFGDASQSVAVLDGNPDVLDAVSALTEQEASGSSDLVSADEGLGQQGTNVIDPQPQPTTDAEEALVAAARAEAGHLEEIRDEIRTQLQSQGLDAFVKFRIDERGLVMGLIANDVFFAPARAELTPTAHQVLDAAAPTLVGLQEQIAIEGHANVLPAGSRYATNWELSADRATQVLRHLVERDGMPGRRISAIGYGDARPIAQGLDDASLAANRRVDLVVLSGAPETVRELLTSVSDG
ncbi:flagellar motor protein MotB [Cellulomonas oligotrophica]|uniref:Chemotaxis protein MotB n=1 Tax=Cellulomonas oligotrophica TaxID=931536 RepID=A0A7Y9JZW8_9CELL|nr:flagellar motor protein MotB [Cellulomonas oligotrophica]NYD87259.1 chemotaxis protein MotB [Cellulomonas oligotrophica]GIG34041.1 chemotaxis protein MotB [Cellulomonas oligotrophica]